MDELQDFIDQFVKPEMPPRDNSGRPLLIPRGMPVHDDNRVAYTRASSLGDLLEEFSFLWKWKMRGLAVGLSKRLDLIRLASSEIYTCGFSENERANRESGKRIDAVIERALEEAGVDAKADYGTAIHARTEPGNDEIDVDEKQALDVASCWDLWTELGVVHLGTEIFTACDELRSAGTFDHLSYVPGYGIIVTDKKTSSKAKMTYDIQLGGYSRSDVYNKDTDERMTLEEYVAAQGWDPALINRSVGLIWWVKGGRTQARFLDLDAGYQAAKVAAWVRDERRSLGVAPDVTGRIRDTVEGQRATLLERLTYAPSIDHLMAIWGNPAAQAIWTDDHTAAAMTRKQELS
jgi:hypothetical protein